MAIQQLKGWADDILPYLNQAISSVGQGIAPDYFAKLRLQQMIQQDPSLAERLSNQTRDQQAVTASGIGFVNKNPLGALAPGAKLVAQQNQQAAEGDLLANPLTAPYIQAARAGVPNAIPTEIANRQEKEAFEASRRPAIAEGDALGNEATRIGIDNARQEGVFKSFKLKDLQAAQDAADQALARFPDLKHVNIQALANDAVYGKGDPDLIARVSDPNRNPGGAELFANALKTRRDAIAVQNAMNLKLASNSKEDKRIDLAQTMDNVKTLHMGMVEAQNKVTDIDRSIGEFMKNNSGLQMYLSGTPEERKKFPVPPEVLSGLQQLREQKNRAMEESQLYSTGFKNAASRLPDMQKALDSQIENPPDQLSATAADRIVKGTATLEQALASPSLSASTKAYLQKRFGKK